MTKQLGQIVKIWSQPNSWDDFMAIASHNDCATEFEALDCKVWSQDDVRIGQEVAAVVQGHNNRAQAMIGKVSGFYGDNIHIDYGHVWGNVSVGSHLLAWQPREEVKHHFCALMGHIPVDTGLLMGWCKECNVTMTFNRKTAKYEA
jgi:hypothetical protein